MKNYLTLADYTKPILIDNRDLRKNLPDINKCFSAMEAEAGRFPKVNGVIVDPSIVETVDSCPVCRSSEVGQLFLKWGFVYSKCRLCSHVFMRNRVRQEVLLKLYSESSTDQMDRKVRESDYHKQYWVEFYHKYISFLGEVKPGNNSLLDIGCGNGAFLRYCKEHTNFKLSGVDYSLDTYKELTELLGEKNYYFQKDIETHDFGDKKFGVISLLGVLEHLTRPIEVMRKCHALLNPGGRMLILIPHLFSRAFKILGVRVPTLNSRGHVQFFSRRSFSDLCRQTGFEIAGNFQELPVIDLMYEFLDYNEALVEDILREEESYYSVYVVQRKEG